VRCPITAVLILFAAAGREQQPVAPGGDQIVAEAPVFDWMDNPHNGQENIYRTDQDFIIFLNDDRLPLRARQGNVPLGGGPEPATNCGLPQVEAPLSCEDVDVIDE
jgi:hypothetical protein